MRRKKTYSEEELLNGFNEGDENCFSQIFVLFYPSLCLYSFRILRDQNVAEEIAEEAFVKVWKARKNFAHFKVLKSYLYQTAKNSCINWSRDQKRHRLSGTALLAHTEISERPYMEAMIDAEVLREALSALDELPAKCQAIIKMLFIQGKEIGQVAKELNLSTGTVRTQKARGLSLLRKKLSVVKILFTLF